MLRDLSQSWFFFGTLATLALAEAATVQNQPALAQVGPGPSSPPAPVSSRPCHLLTSGQNVPEGFGAGYNLFSAAKEPLLNVECGSSSDAVLTVGNGQQTMYVHRFGYEWTGTQWKQIALSGSQLAGNDWYVGTAQANLFRSQTQLAEDNFVIAYTCLWQNKAWKCGCRDTSCAQNYWQLQTFKQAVPSGGGTAGGTVDPIPVASRTINVPNNSQLSSAISSAQPGDHIILANGTYSGFTVSRSGQNGKPIVIRAQNVFGAKISGGITLSGDYTWAVGFEVGGTVSISGNGNRISRSRMRARGYSVKTSESARNAIVDHNEIISQTTGKETAWYGIGLFASANGTPHHHRVYRNYLRDAPALTTGDDNSAIGCSVNGFRWATKTENVIEYNLIENWRGDGEVLMAKASNCTFRFNTLVNSLEINSRVGNGSKFIANWCENSQGIRIHGRNHEAVGNRCNIRIMAGDCSPSQDAPNGCSYTPGQETLAAGNTGQLRVGYGFSGYDQYAVRNTTVEAHDGTIQRLNETGTSVSNTALRTIPKAVKLTPSDVGPNAPTAPRF